MQTINWYPGHMTKARRMMEENLKLVDMVIELRDARIPAGSSNPDFNNLFSSKKRIILLSKKDLADEFFTKEWVKKLSDNDSYVMAINCLNSNDVRHLKKTLFSLAQAKQDEIFKRKRIKKTIRAMVVGVPNVGKTTLINSIAGSYKAKTADKPGVTRGKQWIKINQYFELLDTPGMLWPKIENQEDAMLLGAIGSIRDDVLETDKLTEFLIKKISEKNHEMLENTYNITTQDVNSVDLLEIICKNKGWLRPHGEADIKRCSTKILDQYRSGKLGKYTWDMY